MNHIPDNPLQPDPFGDLDVPPELSASLERHQRNIIELMMNLRSAGLSEEQVVASVSAAIASYKAELLETIKRLFRERS